MDKPHYAADEPDDYKDKGLPEFVPPPALNLEGMDGEAKVKWRRKNGTICIVSMNGVSLADSDDDADESSESEPRMGVDALEDQVSSEEA